MQIDVRGGPGRSKGIPGAPGPPRPRKRLIFSQIPTPPLLNPPPATADLGTSATASRVTSAKRLGTCSLAGVFGCHEMAFWVPEGSRAIGDKWVGYGTLGDRKSSIFHGFRPEIDPGTPLDRRGSPGTSICNKNQARRPILRPFRGDLRPVNKIMY